MKKIVTSLLIFTFLCSGVYAYAPTQADKSITNSVEKRILHMNSRGETGKLRKIYAKIGMLTTSLSIDSREYYILMQIHSSLEQIVGLEKTVHVGDQISVDYIGSTDGEIFDTNIMQVAKNTRMGVSGETLFNPDRPYQSLTFEVGGGVMIEGFDRGVIGMKVGEKRTVIIPPEEAYGLYNEQLVQEVPLTNFTDSGIEIVEGEKYNFGSVEGEDSIFWNVVGTVLRIDREENIVLIDFNPELTGKTLTFEIEMLSID